MLRFTRRTRRLTHQALASLGAGLFAWSAFARHGGPDAIGWIVLYAAACAACVLLLREPELRAFPVTVAAFAGVSGLLLLAYALHGRGLANPFSHLAVPGHAAELTREILALVLAGVFLGALAAMQPQPPDQSSSRSDSVTTSGQ